jgi:hypothetical protein
MVVLLLSSENRWVDRGQLEFLEVKRKLAGVFQKLPGGKDMRISLRPMCAALVLSAVSLLTIDNALAGCGFAQRALKPIAWDSAAQTSSALRPAVYHPGSDEGRFLLASDDWDRRDEPSIVGMWRFELLGPNGALVDDGYAQWHSDGTEVQNSGVHAPPTSNFCLGVWEKVANRTYRLNHFPLAWDATGQTSAAEIQLTETVKLTDDDHMTGTFTLKVYLWDSTKGLDVSGPAVQTVTGTLTAQRVTINSSVPGAQ